jgi:spore maturation protein CgeB
MKIVIFGLTISSSWGNGHATLWRGLCKGLAKLGHDVVFFERNAPYYTAHRDWQQLPDGELILYDTWRDVLVRVRMALTGADVGIVTSYCPDAVAATQEMLDAGGVVRVFYDLDTPVTLDALRNGRAVAYLPLSGLREFDLVLSYTGGTALEALEARLGAANAHALYGHVDPDVHRPVQPVEQFRADLSYLGTYAADRQPTLERLFVRPARLRSSKRFLIGGAQYPEDFPWTQNVYFVQHVAPSDHAAFFCSSRLTLNVTRAAMAAMGWCPSGRLFEAAACGAVLLSDWWAGLDAFYAPESEILIADDTTAALLALELSDATLRRIGKAARERTLDEHTCHHRARELCDLLHSAPLATQSHPLLERTQPRSQCASPRI